MHFAGALLPFSVFNFIAARFQAVMNAMDRDAISGWGAVVHIIEKDKVNLDSTDVRLISCPLRLPPEP